MSTIYLTDGERILDTAETAGFDRHDLNLLNAQADEVTAGELWWMTAEEKAQAEAEAKAELERRRRKEGETGCHWPAATWQDIARAANPRQHEEIDVTQYYGKEF